MSKNDMPRNIAFFLLGVAVAIIAQGLASPTAELSVGKCSYDSQGEGYWWKSDSDNFTVGRKTFRCSQIGVSDHLSEHFGWRAAYVDLGEYQIKEAALAPHGPGPNPHWVADGYGKVQGFTLGLFGEQRLYGPLSASIEAGGFLYQAYWHATANHIASEVIRDVRTPYRRGLAPYVGLGLSYAITKRVSVGFGLREYLHINSNRRDRNPYSNDEIGWERANVTAKTLNLRIAL